MLKYFNPHSPAESDTAISTIIRYSLDFNPHSPAESDGKTTTVLGTWLRFQSTLSCGEWLKSIYEVEKLMQISIHTLLRRVTGHFSILCFRPVVFQSTLSCGEWPDIMVVFHPKCLFQSTLSCGEWPTIVFNSVPSFSHFNPHSPAESDMGSPAAISPSRDFNPHSPAESDYT